MKRTTGISSKFVEAVKLKVYFIINQNKLIQLIITKSLNKCKY